MDVPVDVDVLEEELVLEVIEEVLELLELEDVVVVIGPPAGPQLVHMLQPLGSGLGASM